VLAGLYELFNSLHVQLNGRLLTAVRRILGIMISRRTAAYPLIHSIDIKHNSSNRPDKAHHINYRSIATTASFWPKGWIRTARRNG
jgi:hypothetical protein